MKKYIKLFFKQIDPCVKFILPVILMSLTGCSYSWKIALNYQPTGTAYSLSAERKPKLYIDKVEDKSKVTETWLGGSPDGSRIKLSRPLTEFVKESLRTEFMRLGITCVDHKSKSDAVVVVDIISADLTGSLRSDITLKITFRNRSNQKLWDGLISGAAQIFSTWGGSSDMSKSVNRALADTLEKIGPLLESENIVEKIFESEQPKEISVSSESSPQTPVIRSDVDDIPNVKATPKNAHAIVIGVNTYREKLPQADFADSDARLVVKYLTQVLGYQEQNVAALVNDRAAKGDFEKYIEGWLPNRVEKGDEVFIYYSGHGAPNPATGDAYLVPYDGDPTYLQTTAYPLKKMYTQLAKLPASKVTVVMDSCFSGAGGRSVIAKGARPLVNVVTAEAVPNNITVLSASAGDQISHSYEEMGHGLFTYFFLKGIGQESLKGNVDMKKVFDFAGPQVSRIARREYNSDQVPQWKGAEK